MRYAKSMRTIPMVMIVGACLAPISLGQEYRKGDEVIVRRDVPLRVETETVGTVRNGDRLVVEDVRGNWLWVRSGQLHGWVERTAVERALPSDEQGPAVRGVTVDARGVLEMKAFPNPTGELRRKQTLAAQQSLPRDVQTPSRLRKVSLMPLEDAIREKHGAISEEMKNLAGLLGIRYVLFYPESRHIVIAGPAEGWMTDPAGRTVGLTSGQPTVQLQDLVTALRAFPPGKNPTEKIGCSIDPTPEGLAALQRYLKSIQNRVVTPGTEQAFAAEVQAGLRKSLGLWRIEVFGVPSTTHFAQVIVEADYRMKLIGIGLEEPPVKIVSFVQHPEVWKLTPRNVSRWYLVPEYQCVRVAKDKLAMQLVGDGVRLIGEEWDTERQLSLATLSKPNEAFVASFTENYSELAQRSPVYAEFRNMIHLAVAAAIIQNQDYCRKAGWSMEFLSSEKSFPVQTYNPPRAVASVVAAISKGKRLMTPTGGGVQIEPAKVLSAQNLLPDENAELGKLRTKLEPPNGKWWWD